MIRRPVLRWCACVGQIDIFVTPTFSFTCKGRGLTVLAASLSRGVLALGAGRGLDVVLAVPDDTTAVTTFLRFVTGSSMTSARGLKFSHIAVYKGVLPALPASPVIFLDQDSALRTVAQSTSLAFVQGDNAIRKKYKLTKSDGHRRGFGLCHGIVIYRKLVRLEPGPSSLVCRTPHATFRETFGERKPPHQQPLATSVLFRPPMPCLMSRRDAHDSLHEPGCHIPSHYFSLALSPSLPCINRNPMMEPRLWGFCLGALPVAQMLLMMLRSMALRYGFDADNFVEPHSPQFARS